MALRGTLLSSLPTNSIRGRPRKLCSRSISFNAMKEVRKGSRYCGWSTNSGREAMPTSGVTKAKKSKSRATLKTANHFDILTDQDKENNLSNNIIQVQVKRRPTDPRNAEMDISLKKIRKVNLKPGNSKDNIYIFINTLNISSTLVITLIIDISISALLISVFSQERAESLTNKPLFVLLEGNNSQKGETPSTAILRILYRRLKHQDKHLDFQNELLKEFRDEIKDLHSIISMLLIKIERITVKN